MTSKMKLAAVTLSVMGFASLSVVAELEAGHRPLHTQTILVSPSPQESAD